MIKVLNLLSSIIRTLFRFLTAKFAAAFFYDQRSISVHKAVPTEQQINVSADDPAFYVMTTGEIDLEHLTVKKLQKITNK